MTRALAFLAFLMVACGGEPEEMDRSEPVVEVDAPVAPEPCGMVFSPDLELLDATTVAATRWSAATGCDIRIGDGGLPVILGPARPAPEGAPEGAMVGGGTDRYGDGSCAQVWMVLEHVTEQRITHEFGHCIGKPGHLEDGIMSVYAKGPINSAALDMVCSVLPCSAYTPET